VPSAEERARWSAAQGILILQYLRAQGIGLPALLFADLDDGEQAAYLEKTLAPLSIVSSREGLAQLAARLRAARFHGDTPAV
jgi:ADP-heptose:LPS heptosyltransferase